MSDIIPEPSITAVQKVANQIPQKDTKRGTYAIPSETSKAISAYLEKGKETKDNDTRAEDISTGNLITELMEDMGQDR